MKGIVWNVTLLVELWFWVGECIVENILVVWLSLEDKEVEVIVEVYLHELWKVVFGYDVIQEDRHPHCQSTLSLSPKSFYTGYSPSLPG